MRTVHTTPRRPSTDAIRTRMLAMERQLYTAGGMTDAERADLSMELAEARATWTRARKIGLWTADAALESPEEE
jgi:hypothetical protein